MVVPNWWDSEEEIDWRFLCVHQFNLHKLQIRRWRNPYDPMCPDDEDSSPPCNQEEELREPENTNSDMQWLAEGMFVILNTIRNSPKDYVGGFTTPWAKHEIMEHWNGNTYQPFKWNEAIARAIRQVANSEGACGTRGDSHAEYVHDVLKKYYAYDFHNLDVMTVTSCNLVD